MRWKLVFSLLIAIYIGYSFIDTFDPESIRGKKVLITGASTGIGEQLAYHYARLGASLVITARRQHMLEKVVRKCQEVGSKDGDYHFIAADMSDMKQAKSVVQRAEQKLGGLDILVLNHKFDNAMAAWTGSTENLQVLDTTLDVNTRAYIHLTAHAMPHLEKSGGSIIVLSSGFGKFASPFYIMYAASKFAVDGFFHGLRRELAVRQSSISVTVCTLGLIGTETVYKKLKINNMSGLTAPEDPADTALAIIKGGASRTSEIYYPYLQIKPLVLFRDWFTNLFEMGFARNVADLASKSKV